MLHLLLFAPLFLLTLGLLAAVASVDPAWWTSHPDLDMLAQLSSLLRAYMGPAALIGSSLALSAFYRTWTRARSVEADRARAAPAPGGGGGLSRLEGQRAVRTS